MGNMGSIPGLGRSPGEGNGYPLQKNSMDCIVHRVTKSRTLPSNFHTGIHMSPSFLSSLPPPILSHLSRLSQSTSMSSLHLTANPHGLSILQKIMFMFQHNSLSSSYPLFPPLCPQVYSLGLHLDCKRHLKCVHFIEIFSREKNMYPINEHLWGKNLLFKTAISHLAALQLFIRRYLIWFSPTRSEQKSFKVCSFLLLCHKIKTKHMRINLCSCITQLPFCGDVRHRTWKQNSQYVILNNQSFILIMIKWEDRSLYSLWHCLTTVPSLDCLSW